MAKFHAMDLYDIQQQVVDLAGHASLTCPQLASNFGTSASSHGSQAEYDPSQTVSVGQITPLYHILGCLLWTMDNNVHVQQMAWTSKVGYVQMYNFVHRKKDGY